MTIQEIKNLFEQTSDADRAIKEYTEIIEAHPTPDSTLEQALTERGMLHWRAGHRALAINDYNAALRLNPNGAALQLRTQAYEILDFYNKDLYNP